MGNSINKIKFLGRKFYGIRNLSTAPAYDPDAQNYFNSNTAITSTADKNAFNTFYLGLKSDGIYTLIKTMYLYKFTTSTACKWNLINPQDTDGAYRQTFTTGWTHTLNGSTPNGVSAFADTFFTPNGVLNQNSQHFSVYSRTNNQTQGQSYGATSGTIVTSLRLRDISGSGYYQGLLNSSGSFFVANPDNSSAGFFIMNRLNNTQIKLFRNGILKTTPSVNSIGNLNNKLYISARRDGTIADGFDNKQISLVSIGDGLTDAQALLLSNRVNTLMTYFGINTY